MTERWTHCCSADVSLHKPLLPSCQQLNSRRRSSFYPAEQPRRPWREPARLHLTPMQEARRRSNQPNRLRRTGLPCFAQVPGRGRSPRIRREEEEKLQVGCGVGTKVPLTASAAGLVYFSKRVESQISSVNVQFEFILERRNRLPAEINRLGAGEPVTCHWQAAHVTAYLLLSRSSRWTSCTTEGALVMTSLPYVFVFILVIIKIQLHLSQLHFICNTVYFFLTHLANFKL